MRRLRRALRRWLGIADIAGEVERLSELYANLASIGVDVHFKEPHMILIYSRLNGGQLRHIDVRLENLRELEELVRHLRREYGTDRVTWDLPRGIGRDIFGAPQP